ncbi:ATP-binding protein [Nocardia sp. NPDC058666]|uniref:AAA family ATPase n=1 Tax=Nocardia sp. NPDC058666 TaxID=3346587 RepID=UPI00364D0586
MDKPDRIVGRDRQWGAVERFLFDGGFDGPLRLGLVSGRRRTGKTQLLAEACREVGGLYSVCVQDEGDLASRRRFAADISGHLSTTPTSADPPDWETLLRSALEVAERTTPRGRPPLVVIDEFPYAVAHAPELPSILQHLYDRAQRGSGLTGRLILCGSALSVMHELLSGAKPLRGRVMLDLRMPPLDYREAAQLWGITDPQVAFRVHATVGGIPGYRPLILGTPRSVAEFDDWVITNLLAVDFGVFTHSEVDYLLREDPRITSRAIYFDILSAIAAGAHTPTAIGGAIGRDANAVRYQLGVLESAGYISRMSDLLRARKPTITVADPLIRFDRLITAPHLGQLEFGRAARVWSSAAPTFRSNILGAHFEQLARDWAGRFAPDELNRPDGFGDIGFATVQDNAGRAKHEIDVLGVSGRSITLIGEAKATLGRRGVADLARLDHIADILRRSDYDTTDATIVLFASSGFTTELEQAAAHRRDVELVDLDRLYGG